jgi:hypothetical protein
MLAAVTGLVATLAAVAAQYGASTLDRSRFRPDFADQSRFSGSVSPFAALPAGAVVIPGLIVSGPVAAALPRGAAIVDSEPAATAALPDETGDPASLAPLPVPRLRPLLPTAPHRVARNASATDSSASRLAADRVAVVAQPVVDEDALDPRRQPSPFAGGFGSGGGDSSSSAGGGHASNHDGGSRDR